MSHVSFRAVGIFNAGGLHMELTASNRGSGEVSIVIRGGALLLLPQVYDLPDRTDKPVSIVRPGEMCPECRLFARPSGRRKRSLGVDHPAQRPSVPFRVLLSVGSGGAAQWKSRGRSRVGAH